jgi:hypothetical protein
MKAEPVVVQKSRGRETRRDWQGREQNGDDAKARHKAAGDQ